jgi:ribosomal-protein-serine acetyltransferase
MKLNSYLRVDPEIELKKIRVEHSQELFELIDASREHLREFLPWLDMCKTYSDELKFIEEMTERFEQSKSLDLGIFYRGKIVGVIGTHELDWVNRKTSLGYWLGKDFQGKGIIVRSCRALIDYLFNVLKLHRIEICCAVNNFRSQRVPEKLGFQREGILKESEDLYGKYIDLILYSKINRS